MIDPGLLTQLADEARREGVRKLVVGAVIAIGTDVLLLKRPQDDFMGGIYELPSGNVEPGETLDVALRREVHEETGLEMGAITGYLGRFDYASASGKKSRQFNFIIEVTATGPVRLQEHDTYLWAAPDADPPVTDAVKNLLANYAQVIAG
ncbi:MAG TPA: DNA mismatch repair protein MutT [Actinobacteria bacterium]|nr:DNA mismatch repair protein MutT [Actinomycetota bacterium]